MNQPTVAAGKSPRARILYVENGIGYGGAIICLRHLVRNLDRSRFEPVVVTGRTGPEYAGMAAESRWVHIADRHLDVVRLKEQLARASWPDTIPGLRWLASQLIARSDDIFNFLPFFLRLMWTTARLRPQLVHANNEPLCNRAALLVAKLLGIPAISHVRGQQQGSPMMQHMFSLPDQLIPVSRWISQSIGNLGVPAAKRTVIYDGIELDKLPVDAEGSRFRERHGIPRDAFAVGLVGLLIAWKGQGIFIEAARQLAGRIPNLRMVIIGGTPDECADYEERLRRQVDAMHLNHVIVFTGHQTNMAEVYNGLDVVVSASTLPEPLGTVVIECMAMGRPLIGPNHGGAAEMAEHELTALLFEPGNADDLARCIQRLHDDPGFAARLGAAAREKALQTFSVAEHVRNVQAVYDRVLQSRQQSS